MDTATLEALRSKQREIELKLHAARDDHRAQVLVVVGKQQDLEQAKTEVEVAKAKEMELEDRLMCLRGESESLAIQIREHEELS